MWSQSQKAVLSSDCSLQLDCMKLESLVIADQHAAVNTFPGLVHTARHITKVGCTRSGRANPSGGHVVTRSEEHTSELQSRQYLVCRLLLEKKKTRYTDK